MARIRTIKPDFFDDEEIAAMSFPARLAFIGLWQQADREGRLRDRPVRLKARIFPFDDVNMVTLLDELEQHRFIRRYAVDGESLIHVRTFGKHQQINAKEAASQLPAPPAEDEHGLDRVEHVFSLRGKEGKGKEEEGKGEQQQTPSAQDVVDLWNQLVTPPIPQVTKLTADRRTKIDARLKTYPDLTTWRTAIAWVNGQDWCRAPGHGKHPNWTASIDWLCRTDGTITRCLEQAEAFKRVAVQPRAIDPVKAKYGPKAVAN